MHDIKYFFSIKLIRQSRGQKKFSGEQITKSITEKHYFSKSKGGNCPLDEDPDPLSRGTVQRDSRSSSTTADLIPLDDYASAPNGGSRDVFIVYRYKFGTV
jgi:hypothetical protein